MTSHRLTVIIDVPRGSFVKRGDDGAIDFVYPLPCPFNYGHVPGTTAEDGDHADAVVLGRRLALGSRTSVLPRGRVNFVDAGCVDTKWVCSEAPLTGFQRWQVTSFFRVYAVAKSMINRVAGRGGPTRYLGWLR